MPKNGTPPKKGNSRGKKALGRAGFEKGTCCSGDGRREAGGESQGESCALGQACDGTGWLQGLGMLRFALSPCRDSDVSKAKAASTQLVRARNIPVVAQSPRTRAGGCSITPPLGTTAVSPQLKTALLVLPDARCSQEKGPSCPSSIIHLPSTHLHSTHRAEHLQFQHTALKVIFTPCQGQSPAQASHSSMRTTGVAKTV